jgi:hypothetical protein
MAHMCGGWIMEDSTGLTSSVVEAPSAGWACGALCHRSMHNGAY